MVYGDVQVPRDRAINLCELAACQIRNGKLQLLIEDNLNRDYEVGVRRDIDGQELLGRNDTEDCKGGRWRRRLTGVDAVNSRYVGN